MVCTTVSQASRAYASVFGHGECASSPPLRCRHCCTDRHAVVLSGHDPPSHHVSDVPSGGRYGQSGTPHLCAMPTTLSHLWVNEWEHRIFVLCPPYSSPARVEWSMISFLIKLLLLPPSRGKLVLQKRDFTFDSSASQGNTAAPFSPTRKTRVPLHPHLQTRSW